MLLHITNLDDGGKVLSIDVVLCLQVQVTQLTGSYGVVLGIELIKTLECLSTLQKKEEKKKQELGQGRLTEGMCRFLTVTWGLAIVFAKCGI